MFHGKNEEVSSREMTFPRRGGFELGYVSFILSNCDCSRWRDYEHRFMDPAPRVTMAEVARAAGVSRATVSKALRNDHHLPPERCAQVQKIAAELGYRPHPMVSALMAQLHQQRRSDDPFQIAWIDLWPAAKRSVTVPFWNELFAGARARARSLGFDLEVYRPTIEGISPQRLKGMLNSRGQWGLIIPPVPEEAMHYDLDMREFAGVTVGTSLRTPVLKRVSSNHFQGAQLACERLRAQGFRRIGLALSQTIDDRVDQKWSAAYLAAQLRWPAGDRLPPLLLPAPDESAFARWLAAEQPDAILLTEPQIVEWLNRKARRAAPRAVWLALDSGPKRACGIDHQPREIGGAAVESIIDQIYRNSRGCAAVPSTLLLDGVWSEG